jgi:hypothetical protein
VKEQTKQSLRITFEIASPSARNDIANRNDRFEDIHYSELRIIMSWNIIALLAEIVNLRI